MRQKFCQKALNCLAVLQGKVTVKVVKSSQQLQRAGPFFLCPNYLPQHQALLRCTAFAAACASHAVCCALLHACTPVDARRPLLEPLHRLMRFVSPFYNLKYQLTSPWAGSTPLKAIFGHRNSSASASTAKMDSVDIMREGPYVWNVVHDHVESTRPAGQHTRPVKLPLTVTVPMINSPGSTAPPGPFPVCVLFNGFQVSGVGRRSLFSANLCFIS